LSNLARTCLKIKKSFKISWEMRSVETIPGMGGGQIKANDGGGEFNYDMLLELLQMSQCTPSTTIIKNKIKPKGLGMWFIGEVLACICKAAGFNPSPNK
jgi:hypothetical protein